MTSGKVEIKEITERREVVTYEDVVVDRQVVLTLTEDEAERLATVTGRGAGALTGVYGALYGAGFDGDCYNMVVSSTRGYPLSYRLEEAK